MDKKNNLGFIALFVLICLIIIIYISGVFSEIPEETKIIYTIGDTVSCPNFNITLDKIQFKKKGASIDSYYEIADPEWIAATITVKNTSADEHTFYSSNVSLQNSNGEILELTSLSYKIWKVEPLNSPTLTPGGTKTGYIQFTNTNTDNSNLTLLINCNDKLFGEDTVYKFNISQK